MQSKAILLRENLIDESNKPVSWDKRQAPSDSSAARVAKFRERKKQTCNAKVTPQDIDKEEEEEERDKSICKNKKIGSVELLGQYGISGQLASDFVDYRKGKKAPITKTTMNGFEVEAIKAGISIQQAVEITIQRGWNSFNSEWHKGNNNEKNYRSSSAREHSANIGQTLDNLIAEEFGQAFDSSAIH